MFFFFVDFTLMLWIVMRHAFHCYHFGFFLNLSWKSSSFDNIYFFPVQNLPYFLRKKYTDAIKALPYKTFPFFSIHLPLRMLQAQTPNNFIMAASWYVFPRLPLKQAWSFVSFFTLLWTGHISSWSKWCVYRTVEWVFLFIFTLDMFVEHCLLKRWPGFRFSWFYSP